MRKHPGYRSTNAEIISIAKKEGFELMDYSFSEPHAEVERSVILRKIILLKPLGYLVPYARLFTFYFKKKVIK